MKMKKLLVMLLATAATMNLVACGGGSKDDTTGGDTESKATSITVQVEEGWLPYYEKVKEEVLKENEGSEIEFITTGSFDHLDVLDKTDLNNEDVADVFALPADRFDSLATNNVLAAIDAEKMAEEIGGFKDFKGGLGGNFEVDGDYLAFPYNIETLIGYVNVENAKAAGIDTTKPIEFTELNYEQMLSLVHDCWFGVAFTNAVGLELLSDDLKSDMTKEFSELTPDQQKLFEALFNYWKAHKEAGTDLWDKDAAGGYLDDAFSTGKQNAIRIDGPWAQANLTERVGSEENLEVIPLTQITVNGKQLKHWKSGWALGVNARNEEDEAKLDLATDFIEEVVNPENAADLFASTGKILENVEPSAYDGVDAMSKKVIDATYESYEVATNRPLFKEYGDVWGSWQNALLSWSSTNPTNAEEAYAQVKASFEAMMANFN